MRTLEQVNREYTDACARLGQLVHQRDCLMPSKVKETLLEIDVLEAEAAALKALPTALEAAKAPANAHEDIKPHA